MCFEFSFTTINLVWFVIVEKYNLQSFSIQSLEIIIISMNFQGMHVLKFLPSFNYMEQKVRYSKVKMVSHVKTFKS